MMTIIFQNFNDVLGGKVFDGVLDVFHQMMAKIWQTSCKKLSKDSWQPPFMTCLYGGSWAQFFFWKCLSRKGSCKQLKNKFKNKLKYKTLNQNCGDNMQIQISSITLSK